MGASASILWKPREASAARSPSAVNSFRRRRIWTAADSTEHSLREATVSLSALARGRHTNAFHRRENLHAQAHHRRCEWPANPLEQLEAASASPDAPAGYTVQVSTGSGKSLVTQKPNITKVQDALLAVFPDLAAYFGNRPTIGSAYQDAKNPSTGGATFAATFNGQPVRGIVSCKLHNSVASVAVIFGRTDAPKADWEKLMAPPAPPANAAAGAAATPTADASAPGIPLKEYDYADGTGSLGLADGWTTQAQSATGAAVITGPADQMVLLHSFANVNAPDSMAVKQRQQLLAMQPSNAANARRSGFRLPTPPPLPPLMVAPLADPATALPAMIEQFSQASQFNHGPALTFVAIVSTQELPCQLQGAKRALITFTYTRTLNGQATLYRERADLMTSPLPGGSAWMWGCQYGVYGPDATFDHDLPVMLAMVQSEKGNPARIQEVANAKMQQSIQAGQQILADGARQRQASYEQFQKDQQARSDQHQQYMAQTQAGYDAHNQQFQNYELQRSRNSADFDESILGTRAIYDTVTGQSGYANLTDVNGVVDSLNQAALDPNRYIQIPLRDQLYPLPAGK